MIIVWLAKAITNRDALIDHIALENLQAAIDQDNQIELHMIPLKDNPEIGRIGRKQGTRELVLSNFDISNQTARKTHRDSACATYISDMDGLKLQHKNHQTQPI